MQLGHHEHSSRVEDSDLACFHVLPGDILVMGSDGLFDNVSEKVGSGLWVVPSIAWSWLCHQGLGDAGDRCETWRASTFCIGKGHPCYGQHECPR